MNEPNTLFYGYRLDPTCKVCGGKLKNTSFGMRGYCSPKCYSLENKTYCKTCGGIFVPRIVGAAQNAQIYCSSECQPKPQKPLWEDRRSFYYHIEPGDSVRCSYCGEYYEFPEPDKKWSGYRKYCSPECQQKKTLEKQKNKIPKDFNPEEEICESIYQMRGDGQSIFSDPDFIEQLTGISCSKVSEEKIGGK